MITMGQNADDMVEGYACALCGCYFIDPNNDDALYTHGYPAVCWSCWDDLTSAERKMHQKAEVDTL